ncbi:two component, sigma54 specific, transcriptional regulator, Fis family [Shewanella baltica OS625]|uniref:Two component, sigma54 specific, transcriptional regulator, Fis family n=1 Tax=Shewanella baltica (strain OS195) TaxID=399599 RepID=A9L3G1_SHEB9|nr:sigma-54 dependent transcriptional regulator [Shewanella baltica]ABX48210.1 two component, sigma54 specific, transcriptional regulator, Fis family [Shewanella baltica OS195]ADT93239.1 two component, sigma54 specific, transcriptional regulator, Fis family [Shewanella baltica OS678]EHC05733.1 two component, sigma54 specific, transcriptional regulator, Fis family [Shewanella baltica OS625]
MDTILIVDDNHAICQALGLMLELNDYRVLTCHSPEDALGLLATQDVDLVIQDMNFTRDTTSGEEGKQLFYALRERQGDLPIILMTAWTQLETAVELVKAGAADYMGKPWDDAKVLNSITNLIALYKLSRANHRLERVNHQRQVAFADADLCGIVFGSGAMQRCIDLALQLARSDVSVLITGPNGAGKDKLADILHANSPLKNKPFIKVNVGALPMDLLEAELFGAEAGAFTGATKARIGRFEAADGGTLFLDEIGNLPLSGQVKLLRVLQTGEFERLGSHKTQKVKVRVISATNADLAQDIAEGRFREDLFYRLNVIELALSPLNQRTDDILPLVQHFIGSDFSLSKPALQALLHHRWPGNVRELENACKRAVLLAKSHVLTEADFGLAPVVSAARSATSYISAASEPRRLDQRQSDPRIFEQRQSDPQPVYSSASIPANATFSDSSARDQTQSANEAIEVSREDIEAALKQHHGVIARVAKALGLSRQALYRRMDKFGLDKS